MSPRLWPSACPLKVQLAVFEQAGLSQSLSYKVFLGEKGCLMLANAIGFWLMFKCGRRTLYVWGLLVTLCGLLVIGGLSFAKSKAGAYGSVAAVYVWNMAFDAFLGPSCYAIVSEVPSTRLRAKSVALSKWSQSLGYTVGGVLNPFMINPSAWNWKVSSCSRAKVLGHHR